MSIVTGKNVAVQDYIESVDDYITIGCATTMSYEFSNEIILKTDANAGLFRKKRIRMSDFRGSVQGIMDSESTPTRLTCWHFLQEAIRRSERQMRFVFTDELGNDKIIEGKFLVAALSYAADVAAFTDFDLQLEGTGGITIDPVPDPGEIICEDWARDSWILAEGETAVSGAGLEGRSFAGTPAGDILLVFREGLEFDAAEGAPGNREYGYDETEISFENAALPGGEKVTVVWISEDGS
jgi:predicted secreted protein